MSRFARSTSNSSAGCAKRREPSCRISDLIGRRGLDRDALARWVTEERDCECSPRDACLLLANVPLTDDDDAPRCDPGEVDTSVRPILASNVVLMELILALLERERHERQY